MGARNRSNVLCSVSPTVLAIVVIGSLAARGPTIAQAPEDPERVRADADTSYAIGHDVGEFILQKLADDGLDVELDDLLAGIADAARQGDARLSSVQRGNLLRGSRDAGIRHR